jgi:hypothetical protein
MDRSATNFVSLLVLATHHPCTHHVHRHWGEAERWEKHFPTPVKVARLQVEVVSDYGRIFLEGLQRLAAIDQGHLRRQE